MLFIQQNKQNKIPENLRTPNYVSSFFILAGTKTSHYVAVVWWDGDVPRQKDSLLRRLFPARSPLISCGQPHRCHDNPRSRSDILALTRSLHLSLRQQSSAFGTRWVNNEQIQSEKNFSASKNLPQNIAPRLHYVKVKFLLLHNLIELLVLVSIQIYFRYNVEYHLTPSTGFSLVVSSWNKVSTNRTDFRKSLMWMLKLMNKKIGAIMKLDCLSHKLNDTKNIFA